MRSIKTKSGYVLIFEIGDSFIDLMHDFAADNKQSGFFTGLGASQESTIGYYDLSQKEYQFQKVPKLLEVTNITGNISFLEDKPVVHAHVNLSDDEMLTYGGHVKELIVGGTLEVIFTEVDEKLIREYDDETGLNLISNE